MHGITCNIRVYNIIMYLYYGYARMIYSGEKSDVYIIIIIVIVVVIIIIYYYRIIRPHQVLRLSNNTYAQWTRNRPRLCVLMCKYAATKHHIISMTADWRREKDAFLPAHNNNNILLALQYIVGKGVLRRYT